MKLRYVSAISRLVLMSLLSTPVFFACSDDDDEEAGRGTVNVTIYGEAFIEEGIPKDMMDDGWAISFDTFLVTVSDVTIGGVIVPDAAAVDLAVGTNGAGHAWSQAEVASGFYTNSSFMITRVEVSGSAVKDTVIKTFAWVFDNATHYAECDTTTSIANLGEGTFQITVHADHLFYDSLVSEEPQLLFQALADADQDGDGAITQTELAAAGIGAYDPGNEDISDLWTWLVAQTRTLGHVDGEGHCAAHPITPSL